MNEQELKDKVKFIVEQASQLKDKHLPEYKRSPVNYACIFSQTKEEYNHLINETKRIGTIIRKTSTGPLFKISSLPTIAGKLQLLKIRHPDKTRPEHGDADFTIFNYLSFKDRCLNQPAFKLIPRDNFEMIELTDEEFEVRAYFSNPPLTKQLKIKAV